MTASMPMGCRKEGVCVNQFISFQQRNVMIEIKRNRLFMLLQGTESGVSVF
jgi:hypothetical protein